MKPGFFVREALRSIRANAAISTAATVTVMIAVFILGVFIPSFLYVQGEVDRQRDRLDVNVYLSDAATDQQVAGLQRRLEDLVEQGLVREFTYVSKADALRDLRGRLSDPDILELLPGNPLPASYRVDSVDPSRNAEIAAALADSPALDRTMQGQGVSYQRETSDRLLEVAEVVQWVTLALIGVLLVSAVLLIGNTIRLSIFARRREVEVMRLVGATNWFIRWPFVIEGIVCGVVGAAVSIALLFGAKVLVVDEFVVSNGLERDQAGAIGFLWLGLRGPGHRIPMIE
ncbi:MAG TPA: permease-like cell division protein FtsX, partial [Miltoncostaeaceae bacterium]|nr:permease-like cell division protein FtsX [Miltoncostaeaceae bacterium]